MSTTSIETALAGIGIHPLGQSTLSREKLDDRRRRFFQREESPLAQISLVRAPSGILRWEEGAIPGAGVPGRRAGRAAVPAGKIEQQFVFEKLHDPSQVHAALQSLDEKLTNKERRELWEWTKIGWKPVAPDVAGQFAKKKILLFIHGTFSHCDGIFGTLNGTAHGKAFLAAAAKNYDRILAFNHPTLAVSPMVNAFTLAAHLRDEKGVPSRVDVVCHSRGGLVTRWWLEGFAAPGTECRAVFVASPLSGTSLVAPPRMKNALDFLTNAASAIGTALTMTGILTFVGGLIKILSSAARLSIHSPALDAAVAAIPGLAAQSRVGNNHEMLALRRAGAWRAQKYFAVRADFRPPASDRWKFWNVFCDPKNIALAWADKAVDLAFLDRPAPGADLVLVPNDLVVNTSSMTDLADGAGDADFQAVCDFGESADVMHTNYFEQKKTLDFIAQAFGW